MSIITEEKIDGISKLDSRNKESARNISIDDIATAVDPEIGIIVIQPRTNRKFIAEEALVPIINNRINIDESQVIKQLTNNSKEFLKKTTSPTTIINVKPTTDTEEINEESLSSTVKSLIENIKTQESLPLVKEVLENNDTETSQISINAEKTSKPIDNHFENNIQSNNRQVHGNALNSLITDKVHVAEGLKPLSDVRAHIEEPVILNPKKEKLKDLLEREQSVPDEEITIVNDSDLAAGRDKSNFLNLNNKKDITSDKQLKEIVISQYHNPAVDSLSQRLQSLLNKCLLFRSWSTKEDRDLFNLYKLKSQIMRYTSHMEDTKPNSLYKSKFFSKLRHMRKKLSEFRDKKGWFLPFGNQNSPLHKENDADSKRENESLKSCVRDFGLLLRETIIPCLAKQDKLNKVQQMIVNAILPSDTIYESGKISKLEKKKTNQSLKGYSLFLRK